MDAQSILNVLLRLRAETGELSKVTGGLKEIEEQARQTADKVNEVQNGGSGGGGGLFTLPTVLSAAAVAGYALYRVISDAADESVRINKAILDQTVALDQQVTKWISLAKSSRDFGDVVKLGEKIGPTLDLMAQKMAEFRSQQLVWWKEWADTIMSFLWQTMPGQQGGQTGPFRAGLDKQADEMQRQHFVSINASLDIAEQSTARWAAAQKDLNAGIKDYSAEVTRLQGKLDVIDRKSSPEALKQWTEVSHQLSTAKDNLDTLNKQQEALNKKAGRDGGEASIRTDINQLLREQANLMARIRGEQQILASNPFLSVDQKEAMLVPLITQEIEALNAQIQRDKAVLQGSALDPAQYEQVAGKIQQAQIQVTLLGQKLQTLSFAGSLKADLTAWVNQFGTSAKQVAGIITGTLNTAISATSSAITGLIFGTKSWREAFAQAAQSIVANIIQMLLQWIISRTVMSALNKAFGAADTSAATGQASASAAAWAPAATSASIASYGVAAGLGVAAYLSALGVGTAGAVAASNVGRVGSFAVGGYTGGREGQPVGVVHGEEYVFNASATRAYGIGFLDSMHASVSRGYQGGGFVGASPGRSAGGAGAQRQTLIFVNDMKSAIKAYNESPEGQRSIINMVNGRRVDLGLS